MHDTQTEEQRRGPPPLPGQTRAPGHKVVRVFMTTSYHPHAYGEVRSILSEFIQMLLILGAFVAIGVLGILFGLS